MTDYLVFQLYGSMCSWGEAAVDEYRPTGLKPTRSAILGLVACCLGIERVEEGRLHALDESLAMAVILEHPGTLIRDYHTVQAPEGARASNMATRKAELEYKKVGAKLTFREYRADAFYRVALWNRRNSAYSLPELERALRRPGFIPYLGRKSCPIAAPMAPEIKSAANVRELVATLDAPWIEEGDSGLKPSKRRVVFWEEGDAGFSDFSTTRRNDDVVSRRRWQFKKREEKRAEIERGG